MTPIARKLSSAIRNYRGVLGHQSADAPYVMPAKAGFQAAVAIAGVYLTGQLSAAVLSCVEIYESRHPRESRQPMLSCSLSDSVNLFLSSMLPDFASSRPSAGSCEKIEQLLQNGPLGKTLEKGGRLTCGHLSHYPNVFQLQA
jgi:hypothetical protein